MDNRFANKRKKCFFKNMFLKNMFNIFFSFKHATRYYDNLRLLKLTGKRIKFYSRIKRYKIV